MANPLASPAEPLPEGLERSLADPEAHPGDASARGGVRVVQTHISWVFLTGQRVYKLRKAVALGFLDFSTRASRTADCVREVELNRRLSPDVYLGLAPLLRVGEGLEVGPLCQAPAPGDGEPPEHCVVMRRLPDGGDALSRLGLGTLREEQLDAVAERVARFHAAQRLGRPAPFDAPTWLARITQPVRENFLHLASAPGVSAAALARARAAAERFEQAGLARFEARRREGRAVDGHGDLHLAHIWFEGDSSEPLLVDCIEFNEGLRRIDAAADVAFLAMDLAYRGRRDLAERFLRRYARASDDYDLYRVVDYYVAYRAGVRAKVAALAAAEPEIPAQQRRAAGESAARHLELAAHALDGCGRGQLLVVCGAVGTGKTTLAELAADACGGVVISSDRVRKALAGMRPTERGARAFGEGIYTPESSIETYAGLLERAEPVLDSGRLAILDATFARARQRQQVRDWAEARRVRAVLAEARCQPRVALERLARREAEGRDASDAGPELHARSRAEFEPLANWPEALRIQVQTDADGWREPAARALRALLHAAEA